ncbi:sugar transferase [Nakamurella sp. GG22]
MTTSRLPLTHGSEALPEQFALVAGGAASSVTDAQAAALAETQALPSGSGPAPGTGPKWLASYRRGLIITDSVIIVAVVLTSQALRFNDSTRVVLDGFGSVSYWSISAVLSCLWLAAIGINGSWDRNILGAGPSEYGRIIRASFFLFGFVAIISYLTRAEIARSYLAIALPLGLFGLLGGRWVWRRLLIEYRSTGSHLRSVLVVGGTTSSASLAKRLRNAPAAGYRVAGLCLPGGPQAWSDQGDAVEDGFPVVGDLTDVIGAIRRCRADMVAVAASEAFGSEEIRALAWQLEGSGVGLALVPALTDVAGPRIHIRPLAGLPLMHVEEPVFRGPRLIVKTTLDLVGSALALVVLSPVLLIAAIGIKLTDNGPVFFRQERVGLAGKRFRVWKFRSMVHGADKKFEEAKASANQQSGVFYKSANDSRITPIGRFLRRSSIDELPQLFNVISGQMSLVGPRPLVPGEGAEVGNFLERRMLVRPGITGLWQVSGRSDVTPEERIRLDFYYVENWSVAGDLLIMAQTIRTVLRRQGAY